jgi:hypothetical protein
MIVQTDLVVQDVLRAMLNALRDNTGLLDIIFATRPVPEQIEIKHFFLENRINVSLGYPRNAADLPGLFITVGSSDEVEDFIGGQFPDDEAMGMDVTGAYFEVSTAISCLATNASLVVWLSTVAAWALLGGREALLSAGLVEQKISMRDLMPDQRLQPDFIFRRDLMLQAKAPVTFEAALVGEIQKYIVIQPTITSATLDMEDQLDTFEES